MYDERFVPVSPRHSVRLAQEYVHLLERPPSRDYIVRTITRREANGLPLMAAEIVIAGRETRDRFPLAAKYPLHFRKTYYPGRLHGDPREEYERQAEASSLLGAPPPIGFTEDTFRSCLVPGIPYSRLSPFDDAGEEQNLRKARELSLAVAAGLFRLLEQGFERLTALHRGGIVHGDTQLHNFIVCPSPLEMVIIDYEGAARKEALSDAVWRTRCAEDFAPLLRESVFLQCRLGPQPGVLADTAWDRLDATFEDPERFRAEIERPPGLGQS
ncbi:MAG: hypothetical protein DIU78_020620 [Pseudomonadota bacterium]|nr:MAG: hypothetical protein DIU78_09120 [Pseudomonadota bacterium]